MTKNEKTLEEQIKIRKQIIKRIENNYQNKNMGIFNENHIKQHKKVIKELEEQVNGEQDDKNI